MRYAHTAFVVTLFVAGYFFGGWGIAIVFTALLAAVFGEDMARRRSEKELAALLERQRLVRRELEDRIAELEWEKRTSEQRSQSRRGKRSPISPP